MPSKTHTIELAYCEVVLPEGRWNPIQYDLSQIRFQRQRDGREHKKALFDRARFGFGDKSSTRVSSGDSERGVLTDNSQLSTPSSVTWSSPTTPGAYQTLSSRAELSPIHTQHQVVYSRPIYQPFDRKEPVSNSEQKIPIRTSNSIVAELPGSLLLPSQGFSQSDPPTLPLRPQRLKVPQRRSAPSTPGLKSPLSSPGRWPSPRPASLSSQSSSTSTMSNHLRQPCTPASRPNCRVALPVPLSQMTIEELMQILPSLDAALIAHDWVPCMQKRQRELKTWLQNNKASPVTEPLKLLEKNLSDVFDRSEDIAQTYYQLFEIAKRLQGRDNQKKDAEIYEATAQKSEALIALSRQVSLREAAAAQHERDFNAYKDKTYRIIVGLERFVADRLQDAINFLGEADLHELLGAYVELQDQREHHSNYVRADIYESLNTTLGKIMDERNDLQELCTEQAKTIRQQSQDLDEYLARNERVVDLLREKDRHNQRLQLELVASRSAEINQDAQGKKQPEPPKVAVPVRSALDEDFDEEIWARDAEITNLRRKLDKSLTREKELQTQIKQLIQESNSEQPAADKPQSRIKRFLGTGQKSSPSIPTMNSMQNLSSSILTPFTKDKSNVALSSTPKNGRMSPVLSALCDSNTIDHLELPTGVQQSFRFRKRDISPQPPPRLRDTASHDEIDDAVSSRFHQMPSHVRSAASTPGSSSQSSYVDVLDYPKQPQPQPRYEPSGLTRSDQSFGQLPTDQYVEGRQMLADRHNRVLSGITEVTEDASTSTKRQSAVTGSPDSADRQVYLESIDAERTLGQWD